MKLCLDDDGATQKQTITVRDRAPTASFTYAPGAPVAGQTLALTSLSTDADSAIRFQLWDLDGDGAFDDGSGITAALALPSPGVRRVGLAVVDAEGARSVARREIPVGLPPPGLLAPFPVVRMLSRLTSTGAQVRTFAIRAPHGALVTVRCRGRRCPYREKSVRAGSKPVRFRRLERRLRSGTVIEVFVTERGVVGKYTRFRIRRKRAPARADGCVQPGTTRAGACPGP